MKQFTGIMLKPCPFCGSAAGVYAHKLTSWMEDAFVECDNPGCNCKVRGKTPEEAAEKWNRRVE